MSITRTVKGDKVIYHLSNSVETTYHLEDATLEQLKGMLKRMEELDLSKNTENPVKPFSKSKTFNDSPGGGIETSLTFDKNWFNLNSGYKTDVPYFLFHDPYTEKDLSNYFNTPKEGTMDYPNDKSSECSESVSTLDNLISQIECQLIRQAEAIEFIAIKLNTLTPYVGAAMEYNPDEERELPEGKFSQLQVVLNRMKSHYNDLNKICEFLTTNI